MALSITNETSHVFSFTHVLHEAGTGQKPPNNEIIIQSYYICFILMVILKDIQV
jgi:hypothetical protein